MAVNPFQLATNEEIFSYRNIQEKEDRELKERLKNAKIWDRSVLKSKQAMAVPERNFTRHLPKSAVIDTRNNETKSSSLPVIAGKSKNISEIKSPLKVISPKEKLVELVQQKKDSFLFSMSIDNKRAEISRLETEATQQKQRLSEVETLLESDAQKFEKFLKDNDDAAHIAMKKSEEITRERQERTAEIKRIQQRIQRAETYISKQNESLVDLMKYKVFLDNLSPESAHEKIEEMPLVAPTEQDLLKLRFMIDKDPEEITKMEPLYFTDPHQLLSIFADLEERNLFLIQNHQRNEESLEDLEAKTKQTELKVSEQLRVLNINKNELQEKINQTNLKGELIQKYSACTTVSENETKLSNLTKTISAMVSPGNNSNNSEPIHLLMELEKRLDSLITCYDELEPTKRDEAERLKEISRRARDRDLRLELANKKIEDRQMRTKTRVTTDVNLKKTKPVMFRSVIKKKEVEVQPAVQDANLKEDEIISKFFSR